MPPTTDARAAGPATAVLGLDHLVHVVDLELGREPLARIVCSASAGVDPAVMGIGPVPSTRKALERAGLEPKDIDLVELNEAFASQVLASMRELGFDHDRLNVNGGAIALGHPLGCSGARLIGTLAHELRRRSGRRDVHRRGPGHGRGHREPGCVTGFRPTTSR